MAPIDDVAPLLDRARSLLFITGAGLSAESGLPTYRGIGGLYEGRHTPEGFSIEEALSGEMFRARPEVTWRHLREVEAASRHATFNRAHRLIARAEGPFDRVVVLTQNVDGFHRAAGSTRVFDLHGDLHELECTRCRDLRTVVDYRDLPPGVPTCALCQGIVRPRVVLFGEALPEQKFSDLRRELALGFDLYFSVGTTSVFPYIAGPMLDARRRGRPTVEINPGETEISADVDHVIRMGAGDALAILLGRRGITA
jgi:NAD-dependent deacetylase